MLNSSHRCRVRRHKEKKKKVSERKLSLWQFLCENSKMFVSHCYRVCTWDQFWRMPHLSKNRNSWRPSCMVNELVVLPWVSLVSWIWQLLSFLHCVPTVFPRKIWVGWGASYLSGYLVLVNIALIELQRESVRLSLFSVLRWQGNFSTWCVCRKRQWCRCSFHHGSPRGKRMGAERHEILDHQWLRCGSLCGWLFSLFSEADIFGRAAESGASCGPRCRCRRTLLAPNTAACVVARVPRW